MMGTMQEKLNEVFRRAQADVLKILAKSGLGSDRKISGAASGAAMAVAEMGGRREKRSADDLGALEQKFLAFVKQNPGMRIEQINQQIGTTTRDLMLPIRKLMARGELRTEGEKRATAYFGAGAGAGNGHGKAKKAKSTAKAAGKKKAKPAKSKN